MRLQYKLWCTIPIKKLKVYNIYYLDVINVLPSDQGLKYYLDVINVLLPVCNDVQCIVERKFRIQSVCPVV